MLRLNIWKNCIVCLGLFLVVSCAQQVSPTGGELDRDPPRLIRSEPNDSALKFQGNEIKLRFNEYIQLKDAQNQLFISPPLKQMPELVLKNKELKLKFKETDLKPNTTYTLSFGSSIADITESNADEAFTFVVSTGDQLDSGKIKGTVKSAKELSPEKGVWVMLYKSNDDSIIYKQIPDYISRTKEDGSFTFTHLSNGNYKIAALKDNNQNYLYDVSTEEIAFTNQLINIGESIDLRLFAENNEKQYIKKINDDLYGLIQVVMNKPLMDPKIIPIGKPTWIYQTISSNKDSIQFWYNSSAKDSLKVIIKDGTLSSDTVEQAFKTKEILKSGSGKGSRGITQKFIVTTFAGQGNILKPEENPYFTFNYPIKSTDTSKFQLTVNNKRVNIALADKQYGAIKLPIINKLQSADSCKLIILPGAFTDILESTNDTLKVIFKVGEKENYGNLILTIKSKEINSDLIVILMDEKEKILDKKIMNVANFKSGKSSLNFNYLLPGEYRFKLIYDSNANGKWDTGNYNNHIQPEKIVVSGSKIQVRENWDNEQEWKIDE